MKRIIEGDLPVSFDLPNPGVVIAEAPTDAPVFIVGSERSGSNLLRTMLDMHSAIAAPHPPHILHLFHPLLPAYGPLEDPANFRRLARDVVRLVRWHIHPWRPLVSAETLVELAPTRCLLGLVHPLYERHRQQRGRRRWACKSTFNISHVEQLREFYPGARFLWLVRDPRDVVCSHLESVFGPSSVRAAAALWRQQQDIGWTCFDGGESPDCLVVQYEELVGSPGAVVQRICAFLGEAFEEAMLSPHMARAARETARLSQCWHRLASPVSETRRGRFRAKLSDAEIARIEAVSGPRLEGLGYEPAPLRHEGFTSVSVRSDSLERLVNRARIELRSALHDRNAAARWRRSMLMAWLRTKARVRTAADR